MDELLDLVIEVAADAAVDFVLDELFDQLKDVEFELTRCYCIQSDRILRINGKSNNGIKSYIDLFV